MTTIAWDGKALAADKMASCSAGVATVTKIHRIYSERYGACLVGYTGEAAFGEQVAAWFAAGAVAADYPPSQRDKDDWSRLVVVTPGGFVLCWERTPYPIRFEDAQIAFGSGADFARAAMHCGCDARQAVEVAGAFDPHTGRGVDVLRLGAP